MHFRHEIVHSTNVTFLLLHVTYFPRRLQHFLYIQHGIIPQTFGHLTAQFQHQLVLIRPKCQNPRNTRVAVIAAWAACGPNVIF